jgi:hypothetical protein
MFKFKFKTPIHRDFKILYFVKDNNIVYYDKSHTNYIYSVTSKYKINDNNTIPLSTVLDKNINNNVFNENIEKNNYDEEEIKYTFYGFFKDDFFVIIFDSYNINLDINIKHKEVILIKLKWVLNSISNISLNEYDSNNLNNYFHNVNEEKTLWEIDKSVNYNNINSIILNIRNKIIDNNNIKIDDFIKLYDYKNIYLNINFINNNVKLIIDEADEINETEESNNIFKKKVFYKLSKFFQCSYFLNENS